MPETTENYHRIPVSTGHSSHEIKTITISESEGIKALYCVDCSKIITYLFDVDKWTMEEAQEWVDEHKEDGAGPSIVKSNRETWSMNMKLDKRGRDAISSHVRYKSFDDLRIKDLSAGEGDPELLVRGFFTDDKQDIMGDVITKEATAKAIEQWRKWGNIRTMHDYPSGRVEAIGEGDGLKWNEIVTVPVDEQTIKLLKGNVLKAYSVGIIPREYELNEDALEGHEDEWWYFPLIIHEYDMIEISYVDHPANYSATISDVSEEKDFGDKRRVLFKRMPVSEADMDKENDGDEILDPEQEIADEAGEEYLSPPDESGLDPEQEIADEAGPEYLDGYDEETEILMGDVFLAVGEVRDYVLGIHTFMNELPELVASAFMEMIDTLDDDGPGEEGEEERESSIDEDALVDKIVERIVGVLDSNSGLTRLASIVIDEDEEEEENTDADFVKLMGMSASERRTMMKEILDKR